MIDVIIKKYGVDLDKITIYKDYPDLNVTVLTINGLLVAVDRFEFAKGTSKENVKAIKKDFDNQK